jgi:hypothetical protein
MRQEVGVSIEVTAANLQQILFIANFLRKKVSCKAAK